MKKYLSLSLDLEKRIKREKTSNSFKKLAFNDYYATRRAKNPHDYSNIINYNFFRIFSANEYRFEIR